MFHFNFIEKLKIVFNFNKKKSRGGDGGEIFIMTQTITSEGNGKIIANGGSGDIGGKGGRITVISDENQFRGEISAKGGESRK